MVDLSDDLPDNSPRFVLLSYPLTMVGPSLIKTVSSTPCSRKLAYAAYRQASGRLSVPYVMINYLPPTCSSEMRMLYAGAKELLRNQSEAGRIIEIDSTDDLENIEERLKGED